MTTPARSPSPRSSDAAPSFERRGDSIRALVLAFVAFSAVVLGMAYAFYRGHARTVREQREQELETIARLKVEQISALLRERLGNGRTIHENPGMSRASWPLLEQHDARAMRAHLEGWFGPLALHYGYADLVVLDDALRVMARLEHGAAELPPHARAVAERALRAGTVLLSDPHREPGTNAFLFDIAVPLVARTGARPDRTVGVLLLRAAIADTLQPIVEGWPGPSDSGEIALVGREGDRLVFFTEERRDDEPMRADAVSLSRTDQVEVRGLLAGAGIVTGRDGSGTEVVAAAQQVPGTSWTLIAKMDLAEVMAPVEATERALLFAVAALLSTAAVSLLLWRYRAVASFKRDALARESERLQRQFDALFEHGHDAVFLVDEACLVVAANDPAAKLYGWNKEDVRGRHVGEATGRSDADIEGSFRAAHERGGVLHERVHRRRDGVAIPVEASIRPYEAGGTRYALMIVRDISERRRNEAQLRLTERLTAVGALAAGVAHEINNPLSFVLGNVEWALERVAQGEGAPAVATIATALEEARDGARRVQAIVRDLKTFSRSEQESDSRRPVDVVPVLRSSLNIAQNQLRHRARLVTDLQPVPPVDASEQRLGQVFLNLLVNAAQAIPRNAVAQHGIYVGTHAAPDGDVVVEVRDSGDGMTPEVMRRIFDPFFTTKDGEGTGLGLSICHGIVRSLGGRIEVESEVGRGSTFRVVLPAAKERAPAARESAVDEVAAGKGRVLVVDDEPLVASSMARLLGRAHHVVTVTSARDALARIEGGDDYDVILCDLMMPEMTGMELWAALARLRPGLERRMVFITGGTFTERAREFLEATANAWLEKPFEAGALREAVAAQLRRATSAA